MALALEDPGTPASSQPPCTAIGVDQVEGLFERWNLALASGDASAVTSLYADDALLLPTLSSKSRDNAAAVNDYFEHFLARKPKGEVLSRQILLACNQAIDAGTYRFELQGPQEQLDARYTFVYGFDGSNWRILHHHSSLVPG